nr:F-box associated domain, type 1 [Tanacetum cinerariifolium]
MSRHIRYQKITRSFNPCIEDLLENVMADIISRPPVTKIIHFKSVCKNWREIVSDSYFIDLHLSRSPRCVMIHRKIQPDLVSEDEDDTGNFERPCVLKCLEIKELELTVKVMKEHGFKKSWCKEVLIKREGNN